MHRAAGPAEFVRPRRCAHEERLRDHRLELLEPEGPVVESGGEAEPVLDENLLAGAVAVEHGPNLGDGDVGFVDDEEPIGL